MFRTTLRPHLNNNNMSYFNYDDWKLANPDDSGFYAEDTTDYIEETTYFKYMHGKRWTFAMITKKGHDVRVHNSYCFPTIEIDEIEPTQQALNDEIGMVRMHFKEFAYIDRPEYMQHYDVARQFMDKIMPDETRS